MSFSMMGTTGRVRHRIHPARVRGSNGLDGSKPERKVEVERTHTVREAAKHKPVSFIGKVANLFRKPVPE